MAVIKIKGDLSAIERALKQEPKLAKAAAVSALNKSVTQAQTAGVRQLAKQKRLPIRVVKRRTKVQRANAKRLYAALVTLTTGIPIDQLNARDLKKGGISAGGKRYPHAFRAKVGAEKALIFERKVFGGHRVGRLPIERVKIPLLPEADPIFLAAVRQVLGTKLETIYAQELKFRLTKRAATVAAPS
jgi:hypothetical protein